MITQLEIAIQSTYDTNTGSGPITNALNWECATRLNKVGAFSFEMPLADSKRSLLVAKRYVRCHGIVNDAWTELGKPGIIERIGKGIDGEGVPTGMIRVEGTDLFGELNDILIHELDLVNVTTRGDVTPDVVQYYDGTAAAYIDMTNAFDDTGASVEIPADDEDWLYIGDAAPFDIVTFDLGANLNDDHANFIVQYSTGVENTFSSGTILSDTTKVDNASFAQDGAIRWERQEEWEPQTNNGVDAKYWLRFRYGEDMSGDVTIIEIDITQETPTATALTLWQEYIDVDGNTPISTLGWDFEATHTETQNTVFLKLREVSAFKALTMIAEQTGENFRLGSGREIEWLQDDKTASGIVATNAIDSTAGASATTNCWITSLRQSSDAYELVGRVYPRGGGKGATRVNLLECTRTAAGGYTLSPSLNYLQKDSVESDYGRPLERPKYWPELMSPNAANAKDINVANALYDLTYQYLQRHCIPQTAYDIEVVKLDSAVPVGTTLQVAYWQTVDGSAIMDVGVDGTAVHLWVLESTQRVDNKGLRSVAMKIATTDAWPTSAGAKMQEVVYQVLAIQSTDGPMSAASLTVGSAADLLGSLDLSAYYKKPTNTTVVLGLDAGNVPPASNHGVFVGNEAGYSSTSGQDNTFLGYRTGYTTTTGYDNTVVGSNAFRLGKSSGNVAIGYQALEDAGTTSDGDTNTAVGHSALMNMDTGDDNVAIGALAMWVSTAGDRNIAIGEEAMHDGVGSDNIAIGHHCMTETGAASEYNIGIGENAMVYNGAGVSNIGIGHQALLYNDDGNNNVAIGEQAGYGAAASGGEAYSDNVLIGYQAGYGLDVGGDDNVAIGYQAGLALTTGSGNVFIGNLAGSQETTGANKLFIDNTNTASPLIYGEFDNDLVRINGNLDVTGNITMATTKFIGITGNEIITFQAAGTIDFTGADVTMSNDLTVTNDIILLDGAVVGIAANEIITFNAAGTIDFTGADVTMDNDLTVTNDIILLDGAVVGIAGNEVITFDAAGTIAITGADVLLGSEDGLGKLNFDEGTTIADGIVWGSDANKVTLYRSADDMLKTDDSLTVVLGFNVGAGTATAAGNVHIAGNMAAGWGLKLQGTVADKKRASLGFFDDNNAEVVRIITDIANDDTRDLQISTQAAAGTGIIMDASGNVGIGTVPTNLLSFDGNAGNYVVKVRHTTANTAGTYLAIRAGGATVGATDKNGGLLILDSGFATGAGTSSIYFRTASAGAAGTADRGPSDKMIIHGNGNVTPAANKTQDLGVDGTAWDDCWADDFHNEPDYYYMDSRKSKTGDLIAIDDLSVLQSIKSSGEYDRRTGLPLIDDSTLPIWMLTRDKETGETLYGPDGKPWLSLKMTTSLSWGAIRQLDDHRLTADAEREAIRAEMAGLQDQMMRRG